MTPVHVLLILAGCAEEKPGAAYGVVETTADGATLTFTYRDHASVVLTGTPHGSGDLTVDVALDGERFVPTVTAGPEGGVLEGVVFAGTWSLVGGDAVFWRQGYQSWSWAGVTELGEPELVDGVPVIEGDGDVETVAQEPAATSWWAGLVGVPGGASLLVGGVGAQRTKIYTAFSDTDVWLVYGMRGERIALAPGASVTLDPLWINLYPDDNPQNLWSDWATETPAEVPELGSAPVGWSDWYQYYGQATEEDIRANLAAAAALPEGHAPIEVFQVDDGWEVAWGQWEANEHFPSGTAGLAADIRASGMTPGLWMAPFYVSRSTTTHAEHPDWWVRDADGEELVHGELSGNDYAILDVTHPDAAAWLRAQIDAKVKEGWTYLKLDFLYAGAVEGVRYEDVTGMQAYHRGMSLLRDAMGPEAWFLACGAPMLPTAGYANSWRSGADIAFAADPDPRRPFLRWQARSSAARSFLNGLWWWNDADNLLLRAPFGPTDVSGAIAANVASGGVWLLGDAFANLDADTLAAALDPALTELAGRHARPVGPLDYVSGVDAGPFMEASVPDDEVPHAWTLEYGGMVLLNLDDGERIVNGPGGVELISGITADPGPRTLAPGAGEVWVDAR